MKKNNPNGQDKKINDTNNEIVIEELRVLNKNVKDIDDRINKYSKFSRVFLRGLVHGIAVTIGASLLAGLIFVLIAKAFSIFRVPVDFQINDEQKKIEDIFIKADF